MFFHKHKFKMNYFFGSKFSILKQILFNFNLILIWTKTWTCLLKNVLCLIIKEL